MKLSPFNANMISVKLIELQSLSKKNQHFLQSAKMSNFDCDSIKTAGTAQIGLQRNFGHALTEDGIYIGLVSRVFSLKEKVDNKYLWPFLLRSVES